MATGRIASKTGSRRGMMLAAGAAMLFFCACGGSSSGSSAPSPNSLLQGTCIWQSLSLPTTGSSNAGPVTILSPMTFDGAGHVTFDYYVNLNGIFSTTPNVTGIYQMSSNGHGSLTYTSPASSNIVKLDIYLTPDGHAVRTILQSYPNLNQSPTPRVSSGICRFDE